jgi:hypothetical protein
MARCNYHHHGWIFKDISEKGKGKGKGRVKFQKQLPFTTCRMEDDCISMTSAIMVLAL